MDRNDFIAKYPHLFHMAAAGSWPSIEARGLLSTKALVDLYRPPRRVRAAILEEVRKQSFVLSRRRLPDAIVRDQLPLKFLHQCLLPGVSAQEYLDELNGRVFFHVSQERLHRLLKARAYRNHTHDVITIDTRGFLEIHAEVDLAPYNTGSIHVPNMPARGPSTFVPLEDYPWEDWRRRRGAQDAVTELTVRGAATVAPAVLAVEQWRDGERIRS